MHLSVIVLAIAAVAWLYLALRDRKAINWDALGKALVCTAAALWIYGGRL